MKIFLTGGSGFIGSNLAKKLIELGHEVTITGVKTEAEIPNSCKFIHLGFGEVYDFLENQDCLFHLAANNDTLDYDEEEMLRNNFYNPIDLFHKAFSFGCKKFIYASSTAVYGNSTAPYKEDETIANPLNIYAKSKLLFDEFAMDFAKSNNEISVIGLRYCNIYGPNENHKNKRSSMILQIYNQIKNNKKPKLFMYGEQKRDWCYVKDVVEANIKCLQHKVSGIFNIANGKSISFNELNEIINKTLKKKIDPEYIFCKFSDKLQTNTECDISKAKEFLDWQPQYTIQSGVEDYIKILESNCFG